jgi:hypothetical protein
MPCLLLLLWALSTFALWASAIRGFHESLTEVDPDRRALRRAAFLLAAGPPTLIFLVSAFVLLQAAPTAQFNAGSAWGMDLWSFWVAWWFPLYGCSGLQSLCYLLWLVGAMATGAKPMVLYAVGCALLASLCGSLLLSMAWPDA